MADPCCRVIAGGRIEIRQNGRLFSGVGDATLHPTNFSREATAASNGKMYATVKAELPDFEITLANLCDADPIEFFNADCDADYTIVEKDRGFRHLYTKGLTTGRPEINTGTGEVSGMVVKTDKYQRQG